MASETQKSGHSNIYIVVVSVLVIFLVLTAAQIYLNAPDARPQVACYNLSVMHDLVWVSPLEIFTPDDLISQIEHAQDVHENYENCVSILERQAWLTAF